MLILTRSLFLLPADCLTACEKLGITIRREMNSARWTAGAIAYMCGFAYAASMIVYQLGGLITQRVEYPRYGPSGRGQDRVVVVLHGAEGAICCARPASRPWGPSGGR